jgi:opacity protein-like surface antigen
MTYVIKASLTAVALAAMFTPVSAADLGGSMKDGGYAQPSYAAPRSAAGNCYFRADTGYSWSKDPNIKSPFGDLVNTYDGVVVPGQTGPNGTLTGQNYVQNGEGVTDTSMGNSWLGEVGLGCGTGPAGSKAVRGEIMFGYHGSRAIQGKPGDFRVIDVINTGTPVVISNTDDPLHTKLTTYTMMFNAYKDFGNFGGFTPYVGAGAGLAYNRLGDISFTETTTRHNKIIGNDQLAFAWSLMAGVGFQLSDRAVLDVGYRYLDMGKVDSQTIDDARNHNPRVRFDDLIAHEVKVGIRYNFGHGAAEMPAYTPMK